MGGCVDLRGVYLPALLQEIILLSGGADWVTFGCFGDKPSTLIGRNFCLVVDDRNNRKSRTRAWSCQLRHALCAHRSEHGSVLSNTTYRFFVVRYSTIFEV